MDDLSRMIAALHSMQLYRSHYASTVPFAQHMDEVISILIAGSKNANKGAPSILEDIAKRIQEAAKNWDRDSGKTFCGDMKGPK